MVFFLEIYMWHKDVARSPEHLRRHSCDLMLLLWIVRHAHLPLSIMQCKSVTLCDLIGFRDASLCSRRERVCATCCICPRGYTRFPNGYRCKGWLNTPKNSRISGLAEEAECRSAYFVCPVSFLSDINECTVRNGGCSHLCMNHRGGYKCACPKHYRTSTHSRKKCQAV